MRTKLEIRMCQEAGVSLIFTITEAPYLSYAALVQEMSTQQINRTY